jgi:hypothetical protein
VSRFHASYAASALIAAALVAVAFVAKGGSELGRTTGVEIALVLAGAAVVCAALLWSPRGPLHGGAALALMAALCAVTGLSVLWSVVPELSFVEAGRTLAYLAVFAAAVAAARLAPRAAPELLCGLLAACVAITVYAIGSRIWPGSLAETELYARIGQPFGYWNAVGAAAAIGIPIALWLGSRRSGSVVARTLAVPALGTLLLALLLTQSRGAIAAAVVGAGLWFALVPLRLRSLPPLLLAAVGAVPVAAWALSRDAFTEDFQPLVVREAVAGDFGLLVVLMLALLLLAGVAINVGLERGLWPVRFRRSAGLAALALAAVLPLALFTGVAMSDRGLGGTISDQVDKLTDESAGTPVNGAGRLTAASSSRAGYWSEAGEIFGDRPGVGAGAGTFGVARLRYRENELVSRHAHGFVAQAIADTGLLGLFVALALLAAWLAAALRATRLVPRLPWRDGPAPRRDWTTDRVALVTLLLAAIVFGVQSIVDWTWFIPFPAVVALLAAGFVAGRAADAVSPAIDWRSTDRLRAAGAVAVAVTALLCAWAVWQPERSSAKADSALELADRGDFENAESEARQAAEIDPLSSKPPLVLASVLSAANRDDEALRELEDAVLRYPGEPGTWLRLASFQLYTLERPRDALRTLRGALYLDPRSKNGRGLFLQARINLRRQEALR